MAKFNYVAMDSKGKELTGVLDAGDTSAAVARLREQGLFPTSVSEVSAEKKGARGGVASPTVTAAQGKKKGLGGMQIRLPGGGGVKSKVLTAFTRQLATLIDAGLPLLRGLNVLRKQEKNATLQRTLIFTRLYVNMVRAGEAGGVLDVTLNRLAEFQEKAQKIKNKVISAMVYPCVVIFVALSILIFLMLFIIPKFEEIFRDLLDGEKLPMLTRFVLGISNIVRHNALYVLVIVVAFVVMIKVIGKTAKGRYALDKLKFYSPVVGPLIQKLGIARFTRTLGTLIASGVPILQALNIVRETAGNAMIANAVSRVHDAVKEGERIVQPLEASGVFPPMVISMVDVGEETGALPDMLMKIADVYDDEVDNAVAALTSLLEPIMIVFLAVVVGTIVIAMFLPLIALISGMNKA